MKYLERDKMKTKYHKNLAYQEMGENKEKIILFLHSKIVSKWIWIKQKEGYEKYFNDYHCIFIDLPNHGESQFKGKFSINESSSIIIDFLEDLLKNKENKEENKSSKSLNIIALGIGASIAIEILNKKPELVNHLILSGLEIADEKESKESSIINRLGKTKAEYLNEKPDSFITKAYLRYFGIRKDYYDFMEKDLDMKIQKEKEIAFESLNYTIPNNLNNNILDKKEILLAYGNKEDLSCTYSAIKLKNIFKNARLIEVNKGNHLWNLIDWELFNRTIINFIENETIPNDDKIKIIE